MVRLHTPANYTANILPICLQETELPAGTKCMIAGWGTRTSDALDYPQFLREGAVPIIDQPTCQSLYSRVTTISFDKVCAGYTTGTVDACQGDSGGPLMCQQGNKWYLAGLTSFGFDCAAKGYPGVYANVATLYNWVESQLLQN
jgi:secreted trypsin-like serine protease